MLPHRGEILEFSNRQVPLSRPLFDGFGDSDSEGLNASSGGEERKNLFSSSSTQELVQMVQSKMWSASKSKVVSSSLDFQKENSMASKSAKDLASGSKTKGPLKHLPNCCMERLPNGWAKKAVKHVSGT